MKKKHDSCLALSKSALLSSGKTQTKLTIPEVLERLLRGDEHRIIKRNGGTGWQIGRCHLVIREIKTGKGAVEIAKIARLQVTDVRKMIAIYKENEEKDKIKLDV